MIFSITTASAVFASLILTGAVAIDSRPESVITRDFVIVGGGSSGTYSAFRLQDLNHSVVIIEKRSDLGVSVLFLQRI
jgi:ribulose 1,5-bisphosphate synthetase/thiazole synthase